MPISNVIPTRQTDQAELKNHLVGFLYHGCSFIWSEAKIYSRLLDSNSSTPNGLSKKVIGMILRKPFPPIINTDDMIGTLFLISSILMIWDIRYASMLDIPAASYVDQLFTTSWRRTWQSAYVWLVRYFFATHSR